MKKLQYSLAILAIVLIGTPALIQAETDTDASVSASAEIKVRNTLREKIKADMENKAENAKNNRDYRNLKLAEYGTTSARIMATGTRPMPIRAASSTIRVKLEERRDDKKEEKQEKREDRREDRQEKRIEKFQEERAHIVRQLEQSISNLKQVQTRIQSRITKAEQEGLNMTDAKTLNVTATTKINLAVQAVDALKIFDASSNVSASSTIDLSKPRELLNTARLSIKTAREALNDVIVSIAHTMGYKLGAKINATSTGSVSQ
ncbi:MAG: hypothetical protein WCV79_00325 [Candidatus Paceibacterota bacterium]|jgi:hypothetical protein